MKYYLVWIFFHKKFARTLHVIASLKPNEGNDLLADLSNDSYGTVVNMGLDGEGASPGGGGNGAGGGPPRGYLGATTPPYLSTSRSPSLPPQFPYPPDAGLSVYTTLGRPDINCQATYSWKIRLLAFLTINSLSVPSSVPICLLIIP